MSDTQSDSMLELSDESPEAIYDCFEERGRGDGLPLVPPTSRRVAAMLEHATGDPDEMITSLLPRAGVVTRRVVAVNAVLAGCRPDVFPVVLSGICADQARSQHSRRQCHHSSSSTPGHRAWGGGEAMRVQCRCWNIRSG